MADANYKMHCSPARRLEIGGFVDVCGLLADAVYPGNPLQTALTSRPPLNWPVSTWFEQQHDLTRVGFGKTILLRSMWGFLLEWPGEVVQKAEQFFVPSRRAYTAQVPRLFNTTLRNNIPLMVERPG